MNRRLAKLTRILIPGAFALLALATAAAAQTAPGGASFDLFGSHSVVYSSPGGFTFHAESLGVRGAYRFTSVWAGEAALSRSNGDHPLWNGDISAKAYLFQTDRFALYALAGLQDHDADTKLLDLPDNRAAEPAGAGTEIEQPVGRFEHGARRDRNGDRLGGASLSTPGDPRPLAHQPPRRQEPLGGLHPGVRLAVLRAAPAQSDCRIEEALLRATSPGASTFSALRTPSSTTAA